MTAVQVDGRDILARRIEVEVGVESIARLEYELLPRLHTGDGLDRVMNPIEAVRIVFAVCTRLSDDHWRRALDVAGIGKGAASSEDHCKRRHSAKKS